MANYAELKAAIDVNIRNNGNGEITGDVLNQVLKNMVNVLGGGYQFAGAATTEMNPGTPDNNVYYVTTTAGTYTNFGGLVVNDGELALLTYNGVWQKVALTLPAGGGGGSSSNVYTIYIEPTEEQKVLNAKAFASVTAGETAAYYIELDNGKVVPELLYYVGNTYVVFLASQTSVFGSGDDSLLQFSNLTLGPDGSVYIRSYDTRVPSVKQVQQMIQEAGGGGSVTIDSELSKTSTNPVQNAIITQALENKTEIVRLYVPTETDEQKEHNLSMLSKIMAGGVRIEMMAQPQVQIFPLQELDSNLIFGAFFASDQLIKIRMSTETGEAAVEQNSLYDQLYFTMLRVLESARSQLPYIKERLAETIFAYGFPYTALKIGRYGISSPMYIDWSQGIFVYLGGDNIMYQRQYDMSTGELMKETPISLGAYPIVNITTNTQQLAPNIYYTFAGSDLTISLTAPTVNSVAYEYVIKIVCTGTPNITLPSDLIWANDIAPVFTAGKTYVISIIDNLAVFAEFTTAS